MSYRDKTPSVTYLSELCQKTYAGDPLRYREYENGLNWYSRMIAEAEKAEKAKNSETNPVNSANISLLLIFGGGFVLLVISLRKKQKATTTT